MLVEINEAPSLSDSMQQFLDSIGALIDSSLSAAYIRIIGGEQAFINEHTKIDLYGGDCGLEGLTTNIEVLNFYSKHKDELIAYGERMAYGSDCDDTADLYVTKFNSAYTAESVFNALDVAASDAPEVALLAGEQGACLTDIARFLVFNCVGTLSSEYTSMLEEGAEAYFTENRLRGLCCCDF